MLRFDLEKKEHKGDMFFEHFQQSKESKKIFS
jgi:hypothetical protein